GDDRKTTVIGVMPAGFQLLDKETDLWVPKAFSPEELNRRGAHYLTVIGRLKSGVSLSEADADIKTITRRIAQDHPDHAYGLRANVFSMRSQITGVVRPALLVLLSAVGLVLLIACVNLANLQLSRAAERSREIAVRSALGASRAGLARQLLTESLLLALSGAAGGMLLAYFSFGFLKQLVPAQMALSARLGINNQVFFFTMGVSIVSGILFGLAPARHAGRIDLNEALKSGGRGQTTSGRGIRRALVISEVALALLLLIGAGLLIKTFARLRSLDIGIRADNVLVAKTALPFSKYGKLPKRTAFYNDVLERVEKLPGLISAGYTMAAPLTWKGGTNSFTVEGHPEQTFSRDAMFRQISPDYFRTMGTPLRRGRFFDRGDGPDSLRVAIINETMAAQFWQGDDALGKRFARDEGGPGTPPNWATVVGIVADVAEMGLQAPHKAEMYFPYQQTDVFWTAPRDLVIHASGDPLRLASLVRSEVWAVDPS